MGLGRLQVLPGSGDWARVDGSEHPSQAGRGVGRGWRPGRSRAPGASRCLVEAVCGQQGASRGQDARHGLPEVQLEKSGCGGGQGWRPGCPGGPGTDGGGLGQRSRVGLGGLLRKEGHQNVPVQMWAGWMKGLEDRRNERDPHAPQGPEAHLGPPLAPLPVGSAEPTMSH